MQKRGRIAIAIFLLLMIPQQAMAAPSILNPTAGAIVAFVAVIAGLAWFISSKNPQEAKKFEKQQQPKKQEAQNQGQSLREQEQRPQNRRANSPVQRQEIQSERPQRMNEPHHDSSNLEPEASPQNQDVSEEEKSANQSNSIRQAKRQLQTKKPQQQIAEKPTIKTMPPEELPEKLSFTAGGRTIIMIFVFKDYTQENLNSDLKVLLDNYTRKKMTLKQPDLKLYSDKKTIETLEAYLQKGGIPRDYFRKTVVSFMARIFQKVIEENLRLIPPDVSLYEIQVKISHEPDMQWYGYYKEEYFNKKKKIKDLNHAYLEYTGVWVLDRIVIPWILWQKIDYPTSYKAFLHELSHHIDWLNNMYRLEDYARKRIRHISRRIGNWSLFYVYLVFENLRVEGVQEFHEKTNMQMIDVHMDWVREFRRQVEELIKKKSIQAASSYYTKNMSEVSHKSTYYVGRLMANTITLAVAVEAANKGHKEIAQLISEMKLVVNKDKKFDLRDINRVMGVHDNFKITRIPDEKVKMTEIYAENRIKLKEVEITIMEMALDKMLRVKYRDYIRMYEGACDVLGIEIKNRIVTYAWFDDLKKRATNWYTEDRMKKAVEAGFVPTNYPGDYWGGDDFGGC